jgi:hypothetical protein
MDNNMKKIIIIIFLLIRIICEAQIAKDKYYHAIAGVPISSGVHFSQKLFYREMNPVAPSLIAISAATFKESFDAINGGVYSWSDWAATSISGVITNAILQVFWKQKPKKRKDPYEENYNPDLIKAL